MGDPDFQPEEGEPFRSSSRLGAIATAGLPGDTGCGVSHAPLTICK
jgi:hypothetical protein